MIAINYLAIWLITNLSAFCTVVHAQSVPSSECATGIHAILARGEGGGDPLNVLVSISNLILEQIPGSTTLGLPYPYGNENKAQAVHDGALMFQDYVRQYVASCPNAKILLLGYSLGACAMMDAICGTSSFFFDPVSALQSTYAKNVIVAAAYGDETYVPGMPWNTGNCTVGLGIFPRLNPHSCDPFAASLHSYCDYGDSQCCALLPWDDNAAHHTYVDKYNQAVVDFAKQRLAEVDGR